jgi:predicted nucleic acid-binding protein
VIVADANLVTYLLIDGPFTPAARAVLSKDPDWRLPRLWRYEFAQALVMLVRKGAIAEADAAERWQRAVDAFAEGEEDPPIERVFALSLRRRLSGYDAHYVALAEGLGIRCVTADQQLRERAPGLTADLVLFAHGG